MPNPAGSLGSVFAPHILDTNETKEKDSDSLRRDASVFWRLDAAGTSRTDKRLSQDMRDFCSQGSMPAANPLARDALVRYDDPSELVGR